MIITEVDFLHAHHLPGSYAWVSILDDAFLDVNFIASSVKLNHYFFPALLMHGCPNFSDVCLLHVFYLLNPASRDRLSS